MVITLLAALNEVIEYDTCSAAFGANPDIEQTWPWSAPLGPDSLRLVI
jgi:hypothetical protein